jgi:hypothetical protein
MVKIKKTRCKFNILKGLAGPYTVNSTSNVFSAVDFHEYLARTSWAPFIYAAALKSG